MRLRRRISGENETNHGEEEQYSPIPPMDISTSKKQLSSLLSLRRLKKYTYFKSSSSGTNTATCSTGNGNHVHNRRHRKKRFLFMVVLVICLVVVVLMTSISLLGSKKKRKKKRRKRITSIIKNVFFDPPATIDYYADPPFDPSFNDPDSTQIPINTNAANLFLYGHEWREGVANWLITLSELFIIAKEINATVVLPCIQRGRLVPCLPQSQSQSQSQSNDHADWNYRLEDVFNLDRIRTFHPYFVEQEEFQQILDQNPSYKEYKFCHLYRWRFKGDETEEKHRCPEGSYVYGHQNTTNPFLEQATKDAYEISQLDLQQQQQQQQEQRAPVVMNMTKYDKWGWRHTLFNHKHIVPGGLEYTQEFKLKYFPFQERYSLFVDKLLDEAGIVNHDYVVIQWRAELHSIDYLECAKHIVTARDLLTKRNRNRNNHADASASGITITKNTKFILMSSLNTDESVVWNELSMGSQAKDALHYLLDDHGFLKIDTLVAKHKEEAKDQIDYSIWDTIMAVKAKKYVFCDLSCDDDSICAQCGHRGQFPRFAMKLREDANHTSTMCWPEPSIFDWWR